MMDDMYFDLGKLQAFMEKFRLVWPKEMVNRSQRWLIWKHVSEWVVIRHSFIQAVITGTEFIQSLFLWSVSKNSVGMGVC